MTICIAANCADGDAVVVASDRMLSAPYLTMEFDHPDAKIDQISTACVALTSGDALAAQEVLADGAGTAGQLQNPLINHFAEQVRQRFVDSRRRLASELILEPRGLTFDSFYQHGGITRLPGDLAMVIDSQIQSNRLQVSVIVAGVDQSGAHIYSIEDPGTANCWDRLGYHAIGSGYLHALLTLVRQNQHKTTGINKTVFNVYAAKRAAEAAPGVGSATEMRIVTKSGLQRIDQTVIDSLAPLYDEHVGPQGTKVDEGIAKLPFEKGA